MAKKKFSAEQVYDVIGTDLTELLQRLVKHSKFEPKDNDVLVSYVDNLCEIIGYDFGDEFSEWSHLFVKKKEFG